MQITNDRKDGAVAFAGGQFNWISFFCDPGIEGKTPNRLRVAPYSGATHDFANITTVTIGPATQKVTVALPSNCSGISFQRLDDPSQLGDDRLQPGHLILGQRASGSGRRFLASS